MSDHSNKHCIVRYLDGSFKLINNYRDKFDFSDFVLVETRMNGMKVYQQKSKAPS